MKNDIQVIIKDILAKEKEYYIYGQELAIITLQGEINTVKNEKLQFNNSVSFLFTHNGTAKIQVNEVECKLTKNSIIDILDTDVIQNIYRSTDFEGSLILISIDFLGEVLRNTQKKAHGVLLNRMDFLYIELSAQEVEILQKAINEITFQIDRKEHFDHRELLKSYIKIFLLEFLNIAASHRKNGKKGRSNKEKLVAQFTHLVNENCCEHHEVRWYANELCIDTAYLSRILKSINDKTANQWIDDALVRKAKLYLMDDNTSIKDIAERLHFSDQAAFGKFFKKQEKLSPLNYRRTKLLERLKEEQESFYP